MNSSQMAAKRILVVEDSPLIADSVAQMLEDLGFEVVGPAVNMAAARELATDAEIDTALLDLNIRGEKIFAVAAILAGRNIPFLFASGYANWSLPPEHQDVPRLLKPYDDQSLGKALGDLLGEDR